MKILYFDPFVDLDKIKEIWQQLCAGNSISFFFSWTWMETWLNSLPQHIHIRLVVFFDHSKPVIGFFVGKFTYVRNKFVYSKGMHLNSTGIRLYDEITLENNAILVAGNQKVHIKNILEALPGSWNEFSMPFLDAHSFPGNSLSQPPHPYRIIFENFNAPYVDLALIRRNNGDYLSMLSANTRSQIRRSLKLYESNHKIEIEIAKEMSTAMDILEDLKHLHNKSWKKRSMVGVFESGYFNNFHTNLIKTGLQKNEIQLMRFTSGNKIIGCLYNFLFRKKVYFYQSGLNYDTDNRLKPGLVCHYLAIMRNTELGYAIYDFLAEPSRYKKSMATNTKKVFTAHLHKPSISLRIEAWLKKTIKNRVHYRRKFLPYTKRKTF